MKIREGFVSNSSATGFIITNKTKTKKTLLDFVKENPHLIKKFREEYEYKKTDEYCEFRYGHRSKKKELLKYDQESMLISAYRNRKEYGEIEPGENIIEFGDNDDTLVGAVFDYILRDGGESENFRWCFHHYNR